MTSFFKFKKYLSIYSLFFMINVTCYANTFEGSIAIALHKIINHEYILKNQQALNKYLNENSLEDLITSAEESNRQSQELLFFLYQIIENKAFLTDKNKLVIISDDQLLIIENLMKNTSTPEALFAKGFHQVVLGNYEEGITYLNKAKEAGYALAYIVPLALIMTEQAHSSTNKTKKEFTANIENTYQVLKEMKDRNITVFGFNMLMGIILFMKNEDSKAIDYFTKATNNQEFFKAAAAYIGLIYDRNNKKKLAKQYFITAIKGGNDTVKSRLLDIYLTEGNYVSAFDLLQEIATQWGKYSDTPAIKASFLLSYLLRQGLGTKKDPIQSYIWATRAKTIYDISNNLHMWSLMVTNTNRYALYGNTEINPHITTTLNHEPHTSFRPHERYTIEQTLDLMKIHNTKYITTEQLQVIEEQITLLTHELKGLEKLDIARLSSNNEFETLHPLISNCAKKVFH